MYKLKYDGDVDECGDVDDGNVNKCDGGVDECGGYVECDVNSNDWSDNVDQCGDDYFDHFNLIKI